MIFLLLVAVARPAAHAAQGFWLDVPYVHLEKDGCGAAAISMVMQYWAKARSLPVPAASDPDSIRQALYSKELQGISASAMEEYFRQAGFQVFAFRAEWSDLAGHLRKGRPLIVCLRVRERGAGLHYAVVAGLDDTGAYAFLNDPARRKLLRVARAEFERQWGEAGNWTLLALPADKG